MNIFTPASNLEVGFSKVDDDPKKIQNAKDSEGLDNRGQLELSIENVSIGGLKGDTTRRSYQPWIKAEMKNFKTALKSATIANDEVIEDSQDPVLREILDSLNLSPQLLRAIGTTKKSQDNQEHDFRHKIEDSNYQKRNKAIREAISFRDDYSRTLVNALASKYNKFSDELINELPAILK